METWENDAVTVMLYVSARLEIAENSSAGLCLHTSCLLLVVSIMFSISLALHLRRDNRVPASVGIPLCKHRALIIERLNLRE